MQCIQCKKEFQSIRADAKFCGDACRKAYSRISDKPDLSRTIISDKADKIISDKPENATLKVSVSSAVSEPKLSVATPENTAPDFSKYTAEELYIGINSYELDLWAKSPEYKELIKRLDKLSIKQLREQVFQIPLWKLNNQPCPF